MARSSSSGDPKSIHYDRSEPSASTLARCLGQLETEIYQKKSETFFRLLVDEANALKKLEPTLPKGRPIRYYRKMRKEDINRCVEIFEFHHGHPLSDKAFKLLDDIIESREKANGHFKQASCNAEDRRRNRSHEHFCEYLRDVRRRLLHAAQTSKSVHSHPVGSAIIHGHRGSPPSGFLPGVEGRTSKSLSSCNGTALSQARVLPTLSPTPRTDKGQLGNDDEGDFVGLC